MSQTLFSGFWAFSSILACFPSFLVYWVSGATFCFFGVGVVTRVMGCVVRAPGRWEYLGRTRARRCALHGYCRRVVVVEGCRFVKRGVVGWWEGRWSFASFP